MSLFVGLEVSGEVRDFVLSLQSRLSSEVFSLVKPEKLHVTLAFIGEGSSEFYVDSLSRVSFSPFFVETSSLGVFNDRVLWVGVRSSSELVSLARRVSVACNVFFRFKPHLTVARVKRGWVKRGVDLSFWSFSVPVFSWKVSSFVLFESKQGVYEVVARFK